MAAPGSSAAAQPQTLTHSESRLRVSAQVSYFHNDPSGLPEEVTDEAGEVRWRASWRTWGSALEERWEAVRIDGSAIPAVQQRHRDEDTLEQNLRLQGQYLDRETGLHYNTFRYYDPDVGRFISPDPIGLAGGINLQRYAANPLAWIDPLGLSNTPIVVIGENQDAVDEAARILRQNEGRNAESMRYPKMQWRGGRLYEGMPDAEFEKAVQWNKEWVRKKIEAGYTVVDIGSDGRPTPSRFYVAELEAVKETGATRWRLKAFKSGETIQQMRNRIKGC